MDKPANGSASKTQLSTNDVIEQGIEAAKSGNRLLARWQLESVAVGNDVRPEVWLWLAWVAESPAKAQVYLKNASADPRFGQLAIGGLQWLSFLSGESIAEIVPPVKSHSGNQPLLGERTSAIDPAQLAAGMKSDETVVGCPSCEAILYVRSSAIGRPRMCPACDSRFLVELDRHGAINAQVLANPPNGNSVQETEVAAPMPKNIEIEKGNGDTILVVDDSPTIRRIASMILNKNGYRVLTANTGEEGLAVAQNDRPHLILLDINMPGIGGYETCKRLRLNKTTHHIPVVMLSGKDGLFDQVKGYQAGSSKYLTKPCDARAMLTAVRQLLSRTTAMTSS